MIFDIIQQNFINVAILVFLIIFILTNNNFEKRTNYLFLCSAVCVLLFVIEEAWERSLAQEPTYSYLRVCLSSVGYALRPMTGYLLVMIILQKSKKWKILMSIPAVINAFVAFSALFGKWAFWYTQDNEFVRGPLGITPFITATFYLIVFFLLTIAECKKGDIMEAITVSTIVVLVILATIMESVFSFYGIQSAVCGISITFYYLFLHTNQNNRDPLTGALVRRRFYLDAEKYRTIMTAVISLDLNDLKKLNDDYGHVEGDKALVTMVTVVKRCIQKKAAVYRTGGDEFMILCYKMSEEDVKTLIDKIQEEMGKTPYRCAVGYALYYYLVGLEQVCQMADRAMYDNKLEMKRENN